MEEDVKTLSDYTAIVRRRKWALVLPILICCSIGVIVAVLFPRTYRSTSTILIEDQEIPRDYVMATVTGYAEQHLQSINQRIMSTSRLLEIINRFNLYSDLRKKMTMDEVVGIMRKDIKFATISSDVVDRRTGKPTAATIAFTLAYDGRNPQVVQQVSNVLASLYLEENLKVRAEQTAGASRFLEEEAKAVQISLASLDGKIATFKTRNITVLPELLQVNFQSLDRVERDMAQLKDQLRTLREKEGYLQTQLASIPTETASQDKNLLKELKARLVQLESRFSDKYPDVIKAKAEIAELEKRTATSPSDGQAPAKGRLTVVADQADNISYVTLASQLSSVQSDIESSKRQLSELEKTRDAYRRRTEVAPRVEEAYKTLMTERNNTQAKYDDLMKKVMEAKVAQGLEKQQMGDRFTLIDPARLPEIPVSPNVPAILVIGLFFGIGAGVGNVSLREYGDQSIRSAGRLTAATAFPILGTIPLIVTQEDRRRARGRRNRVLAAVVILCIVGVLSFHFFVMDLDVFWATLSRRLMP
jgi:polysaccharide biosynthesis transport protein